MRYPFFLLLLEQKKILGVSCHWFVLILGEYVLLNQVPAASDCMTKAFFPIIHPPLLSVTLSLLKLCKACRCCRKRLISADEKEKRLYFENK